MTRVKIVLTKPTERMIGNLRLPNDTYEKIEALATKGGVSNQEVIRSILNQLIDTVEI